LKRARKSRSQHSGMSSMLGPLEFEIMEILWRAGQCTVEDVRLWMKRSVAYTTVMTTLGRLFHKGLLKRKQRGRAFLYTTLFTAQEMEMRIAAELVSKFMTGPRSWRKALLLALLTAIDQQDFTLLGEIDASMLEQIKLVADRDELWRRPGGYELGPLGCA
jgi:predicted transcriptional regulator